MLNPCRVPTAWSSRPRPRMRYRCRESKGFVRGTRQPGVLACRLGPGPEAPWDQSRRTGPEVGQNAARRRVLKRSVSESSYSPLGPGPGIHDSATNQVGSAEGCCVEFPSDRPVHQDKNIVNVMAFPFRAQTHNERCFCSEAQKQSKRNVYRFGKQAIHMKQKQKLFFSEDRSV